MKSPGILRKRIDAPLHSSTLRARKECMSASQLCKRRHSQTESQEANTDESEQFNEFH
jgi:hypothetical protein